MISLDPVVWGFVALAIAIAIAAIVIAVKVGPIYQPIAPHIERHTRLKKRLLELEGEGSCDD